MVKKLKRRVVLNLRDSQLYLTFALNNFEKQDEK